MNNQLKQCLLWLTIVFILGGCASTSPTESPKNDPASYAQWDDVLKEASGQEVNWYMWGGSEQINQWVTGYVAKEVKERYNITLNRISSDTADTVNKLLGEKTAGRDKDGSADLIWINGENFRTMRQADLLYTAWATTTPNNKKNVNWEDPSVAYDFGVPVNGDESPYGKAQFVMIYDSAKLPNPPKTIDGLIAWIKENPGKFTYPAPPDFTGTAFMMQWCYQTIGGYEPFLGAFDEKVFQEKWTNCWATLNEIEPFLWREGETYPEDLSAQHQLLANGEVWMSMAYNPSEASSKIEAGEFPKSVRTFVFDSGTLANTHYVAIPYNSPHKAAAMVVADLAGFLTKCRPA